MNINEYYRFHSSNVVTNLSSTTFKESINELDKLAIMNKINTQQAGIDAAKSKNYVIGSVSDTGNVSLAINPAVHTSRNLARVEAMRLAKLTPGKLYVIMQLIGAEMTPTNSISI